MPYLYFVHVQLYAPIAPIRIFVLMCHEAGQSAFLHTQLYLSTNLNHILFSNVS